jgi:elongation factor Ts
MAQITAAMVKKLREATDAGMMECKKALVEADGDFDKAVDVLRTRGLAAAAKKAGRATKEGAVVPVVSDDAKVGALVELACETDFVGMNEKFHGFAEKIGRAVIANDPADLDALKASTIDGETVDDVVTECIHTMGENTKLIRFARLQGDAVVAYIHMGGKMGVLVSFATDLDGNNPDFVKFGRDIAMQVAATDPVSVAREDVPEDIREHEMGIYKAQAAESGKPENIQEKIATGRMEKFYKESVLEEMEYVKDNDITVKQYVEQNAKQLGGSIKITGFARFLLGETAEDEE